VPIPGTTKLHRLDENIGAVALELTPNDLREIDSAAAQITVEGARYPEKLEQLTVGKKLSMKEKMTITRGVEFFHRRPS